MNDSVDFTPRQHVEDCESLYELVCENEMEFAQFKIVVDELETAGYLDVLVDNEDKVLYKAKPNLKWHSDICKLSDPIKKKILLCLIDNPKSFFVLFNTQKGKLRIAGKEISSWAAYPNKRMVSFLVVDNDRTLSEQSVNGLFDCFEKVDNHEHISVYQDKFKVKIFELSSNNKISLKDIITYIDAYTYNPEYHMPLIVALANNKQIEKVIKILHHIALKQQRGVNLAAGFVWDEADKTYPLFRNKTFRIDHEVLSYLDLYNQEDIILRAGFVTATDGPLLEEEYEECANAHHYKVVLDPEDEKNYIAFHSKESIKKYIKPKSYKEPNNTIALRVISDNWATHFNAPVVLKDGTIYYRKTIINSNPKGDDMKDLAKKLAIKGANTLTFNQYGITLYTSSLQQDDTYKVSEGIKISTRKQNFNKVLFFIYKKYKLDTKPLFILGRRKVDRGLGFHYAPRKSKIPVTTITVKVGTKDETILTDGVEGLIWTDLILGNRIEDLASAVQKAGRGAGIIRQCPQFSGTFTYWVETTTADSIERHYNKVDKTNRLEGANTMLQAMVRAEAEVPRVIRNHDVDKTAYVAIKGSTIEETERIVRDIIKKIFKKHFTQLKRYIPEDDSDPNFGNKSFYETNVFYGTSLNTKTTVNSLLDTIKKVPGAYGGGGGKRIYLPCYSNVIEPNSLYCVIPLIDPSYTEQQKAQLRTEYAQYIIDVPQIGSLEHL